MTPIFISIVLLGNLMFSISFFNNGRFADGQMILQPYYIDRYFKSAVVEKPRMQQNSNADLLTGKRLLKYMRFRRSQLEPLVDAWMLPSNRKRGGQQQHDEG